LFMRFALDADILIDADLIAALHAVMGWVFARARPRRRRSALPVGHGESPFNLRLAPIQSSA